MGQGLALGLFGVVQQRGCGSVGIAQFGRIPGGQAGRLQLGQQLALAQAGVKRPGRAHSGHGALATGQRLGAPGLQGFFKRGRHLGAVQHFAGGHTRQPVGQGVAVALRQVHHPLGHRHPGQATAGALTGVHRQQQRFGFV